jgi:O-antigen/teichoic acid export membrane protein
MKITYSVFKTTISIILLLLGFGVIGALFGSILGYTASILPAAILVYRNIKQVNQYNTSNNGVDLYTLIVLLKYSLPLYMGSLTGIILSIYQNVLLSYSLSEVYIGGYRAMYNFMGLISIITTPISLALLPFFTRFDDSVKEKLDKALNMANKYIALIIIPITMISMVFSKELMYILYGREYMFTSIYLPLLFAPNLLAGLGSIAIPTMFNGIGVTRYNMYLSITNALVFIPTSYLLTYRFNYGLWGFLTSTLFSSIITTALAIYLSKKFVYDPINIKLIGGFYIASIISIIPIIPVFYIHVPRLITLIRLLVGGIIYLLIYIGIAIVLNCINKDDVDFIANTFKNYPIINVFLKVFVKYANLILRLVDREKRL